MSLLLITPPLDFSSKNCKPFELFLSDNHQFLGSSKYRMLTCTTFYQKLFFLVNSYNLYNQYRVEKMLYILYFNKHILDFLIFLGKYYSYVYQSNNYFNQSRFYLKLNFWFLRQKHFQSLHFEKTIYLILLCHHFLMLINFNILAEDS